MSLTLCKLWRKLGLSIDLAKIVYGTEADNTPNLYFEVEHVDKSSALLSPLHVRTATMEGIVCLFNFQSTSQNMVNHNFIDSRSRKVDHTQKGEHGLFSAINMVPIEDLDEVRHHQEQPARDMRQHRQRTADLTIAALHKIIGLKTRFLGIRLGSRLPVTLLELAPTVWNAHYMLVSTMSPHN